MIAGIWRALRSARRCSIVVTLSASVAFAVEVDSFFPLRDKMVREQIAARGIDDPRLLSAMREVPRHRFVPESLWDVAYEDRTIPFDDGKSIFQPYLVAKMTSLLGLDRGAKVLEIGTGSGYHTAVLARLSRQVFTVEIDPETSRKARRLFVDLGIRNIHSRTSDGYQGWPEEAPFDAIILTTAPSRTPQALLDQLASGGKMVVPEGEGVQTLIVFTKTDAGLEKRATIPVVVAPMKGSADGG